MMGGSHPVAAFRKRKFARCELGRLELENLGRRPLRRVENFVLLPVGEDFCDVICRIIHGVPQCLVAGSSSDLNGCARHSNSSISPESVMLLFGFLRRHLAYAADRYDDIVVIALPQGIEQVDFGNLFEQLRL